MESCPHTSTPRIGLSAFVYVRKTCAHCAAALSPPADLVSVVNLLPMLVAFAAGHYWMRPGTWAAGLVALAAFLIARALLVLLLFRYATLSVRSRVDETSSNYRIVTALLLSVALIAILAAWLL